MAKRTLYEKLWDAHVISRRDDGTSYEEYRSSRARAAWALYDLGVRAIFIWVCGYFCEE